MRRRKCVAMVATTLLVVAAGCGAGSPAVDGQEPGAGDDLGDGAPQKPAVAEGLVVLAKAEGWRSDLGRLGSTTFAVLEIADDRATAERAWRENVPPGLPRAQGVPDAPGVYAELDDIDLATAALVVWSSGQSGSCSGWLADVRTRGDTVEVEEMNTGQLGPRTLEVDGQTIHMACTDDYNPFRQVLAVDRDRLPDRGRLPIRNITGVPDGLVTTYPAS